MTSSAPPVAPVTARSPAHDDRRLLPRDRLDRRPEPGGVVEVHVDDRRHARRPTRGSRRAARRAPPRRWRGPRARREPAEGDAPSGPRTRSARPDDGRRGPRSGAPPRRARRTSPASTSRPPIRSRSRYVTRCGFGVSPAAHAGLAEDGAHEREDAPLPVRPRDEGAAEAALRVAHRAQDGARAPQAQPDTEPAATLDLGERVGVGEAHRRRTRAGTPHHASPVRSSS